MTLREYGKTDLTSISKQKDEIRGFIENGGIVILRSFLSSDYLLAVRSYLSNVGRNSLPNYFPITKGCPNFHRINVNDERSYVKAVFSQFSFFPWNDDYFQLFKNFENIYAFRNILSGNKPESFLGREPELDCTARISFQFYPKGGGMMNLHKDPVDHHQMAVPTVCMSKKGKDYHSGGAYFLMGTEKVYVDELCNIGDTVLFNAQLPHAVEEIDPGEKMDWPDFHGRWIAIAAVNRLSSNTRIQDAQDLER